MAGFAHGAALPWAGAAAYPTYDIPDSLTSFSRAALVPRATDDATYPGSKSKSSQGIGIVSFLTAIGVAAAIFAAQFLVFVLLRNKLARIL